MAIGVQQQQRRGLASEWTTANPVLAAGELGVTTDTGVVKIGDGSNAWSDLPVAFYDVYLPLTGKAADSELLDGISSDSFVKVVDTTALATPGKVALRDAEGNIKVATGVDAEDAVNFGQMGAADNVAIVAARKEYVARSVTASITLAITDIGQMVRVNHASTTTQLVVTIPTAAAVGPMPVASWIDIAAMGAGGVKISPDVGVTLSGARNVMPGYDIVRLLKLDTDVWVGIPITSRKKHAQIRVYKNAGGTVYANAADVAVPFTTVDAANTYNPDDEWFTIPPAGLPTARRIIVNKDGLYTVIYNTSVATREQSWAKVCKMTGDNVIGAELGAGPTFWNGQAVYQGRLTAGESIGGIFYNGKASGTTTDEADGLAGHRHDLVIIRISD